MRVYVNGVLQGGSAGVPGTPADVLLDDAAPNSIVTLNASGIGSTIPQSSIPTLPAAPPATLLDTANEGKLVSLAPATGVGTTVSYGAAAAAGVGQLASILGDFVTGNGNGGAQLASVNPAATRNVIGAAAAPVVLRYYASNGTPANGGGPDATANVSGVNELSTVTFGVSSTSRTISSSAVGCGTWASPSISRAAKRVTLYLRSTALSGISVNAFRAIVAGLRRNAETPPSSIFLAGVVNAESGCRSGNSRNGGNNAAYDLGINANTSPLATTDRWLRFVWDLDPGPRVWLAAGATTGSTRPSLWTTLNLDSQTQAAAGTPANNNLGTLGTAEAQVLVGFESYGTGIPSLATFYVDLLVEF